MAVNKMKKCSACGADIAASAKSCPQCGQKNKKPFYKKPWVIVVVVILLIAIMNSGNGESDTKTTSSNTKTEAEAQTQTQSEQVEYIKVDVSTLMKELEENAMKAEKTYQNKHVEITGRLAVIDSDGSYISLYPQNDQFAILGVQCYIKNDEQSEKVMEMSKDDIVTLKGKIKSIGEIWGYSLDIESIE